MSFGFNISNYPKLINQTYAWILQSQLYTAEGSMRQRVCDMSVPGDFNPKLNYYRAVVGVTDVTVHESSADEEIKFSGGSEDYSYQMKLRRIRSAIRLDKDIIAAGENRIVAKLFDFANEAGKKHEEKREQDAFDILNKGPLTAGHTIFNNNIATSDGEFYETSPNLIYDGLPYFDGAHTQSSQVTGTTYSNIATSTSWSITNLQTVINTMRTTNAYDRNGGKILISPNQIVANPAMEFSIKRDLKATVLDADLQPNIVGTDFGWDLIFSRYIDDTNGWYVFEKQKDILFIDNWRAPEFRMWSDPDYGDVIKAYYETTYGVVVREWRHSYCCNVADS